MKHTEKNFIHLPSGRWCKIVEIMQQSNKAIVRFSDYSEEEASSEHLEFGGSTLKSMLLHAKPEIG